MSNFSDQENFNIVAEGEDVEGHFSLHADGPGGDELATVEGDDVEGHISVLDGRDADKIALIDGPDGDSF
jgi:hypothetical protein